MVISLESFVKKYNNTKIRGEMGQPQPEQSTWTYDKVTIWIIIILSISVSIIGLIIIIHSFVNNNMTSASIGLIIFSSGIYQALLTIKEKSKLDLLSEHFSHLSESAKSEILISLMESKPSSKGLLKVIEFLLKLLK